MSALFVSDVHLRGENDARQSQFIQFLQSKADEMDRLFIVGDLMDLWFGMKPVLVREHYRLLRLLRRLSRAGVEITYLEGNHDFNLRPYVEDAIEVKVGQTLDREMDGRKVWMAHGDGVDPGDVKYRILKRIVRSTGFKQVVRFLPGDVLWRLGLQFSSVSRDYLGKDRPQLPPQKAFAAGKISDGHDVVILGHAHAPGLYPIQAGGRKGLYVNTGDWLTNFSYVEYRDGRFEVHSMDGRPFAAPVLQTEEAA